MRRFCFLLLNFFFLALNSMSKRYTLLLSCVLILFVFLFVMLCFYSRLATDDYFFIWDVNTKGIRNSLYLQYMRWSGRFSAGFLVDVIYKYLKTDQTWYFAYPLLSFVILSFGTYFSISSISGFYNIAIKKFHKWIMTFSFVALLFFMSADIGESWFWYVGLSCYLMSIIAFIWGIAFLFHSKHQLISTVMMMICFLYIGGASEVFSVIYGILLTILLIYKFKKAGNFNIFITSVFNKKLLIAYITLAISFTILLVAPGNYLRDGLFPKHQFFYSFFITAKSFVKFGSYYLPFKLAYVLTFSVPFIVIGNCISPSDKNKIIIPFTGFLKKATFFLITLMFIFFFLVAYVLVETGPPRIWFMLSLMIAVYCLIISFYAGYTAFIDHKKLNILKRGSIILGFIILTYTILNQYAVVNKYSKAYDERLDYLTDLNKTLPSDTIINLKPLPPAGMLYSAEISSDTNHFTNRELRLGYDLKFHVISKKK